MPYPSQPKAYYHVYADQLTYLNHGYALWEPSPGARPSVRIGDVGYIRFGGFFRLFNVHLPENHPLQSPSLPEYFSPLPFNPDHVHSRTLDAGGRYSRSVRAMGLEANIPSVTGLVPISGGVSFECSRDQGAVLAIPNDAIRHDAHLLADYEKYMLGNCTRWLAMLEVQGLGLRMEDIVLVTGCDLATSWAVAAFTNSDLSASIELDVGGSGGGPVGGLVLGTHLSWKNERNAERHWGPRTSSEPLMMAFEGLNNPQAGAHDSSISYGHNQCIFLRGYRVKFRSRFLPKKIVAAARPHELGGYDESEGELGFTIGAENENVDDEGMDMEVEPLVDDQNVPLSVWMLNYILDHSLASIAIVHDNDLGPFIENASSCEEVEARLLFEGMLSTTVLEDDSSVTIGKIGSKNRTMNPKSDNEELRIKARKQAQRIKELRLWAQKVVSDQSQEPLFSSNTSLPDLATSSAHHETTMLHDIRPDELMNIALDNEARSFSSLSESDESGSTCWDSVDDDGTTALESETGSSKMSHIGNSSLSELGIIPEEASVFSLAARLSLDKRARSAEQAQQPEATRTPALTCLRCKELKVPCRASGYEGPCRQCVMEGHECVRGMSVEHSAQGTSMTISESRPATLRGGACSRCKRLKVKCVYAEGELTCKRCAREGHECNPSTRKARHPPEREPTIFIPRACHRCKSLKVKCEYSEGESTCKRCARGGHECVVPERKARRPPEREVLLNHIREQNTKIEELVMQLEEIKKSKCVEPEI